MDRWIENGRIIAPGSQISDCRFQPGASPTLQFNLVNLIGEPMPIIECVPNVSEGRRRDVVESMARAIRAVNGVRLLDCSSDPSHNRSVFTLVGDRSSVEAAIMALFDRAVAELDLRTHRGAHPRIGVVDVVPFVPLERATMANCVALANTPSRERSLKGASNALTSRRSHS